MEERCTRTPIRHPHPPPKKKDARFEDFSTIHVTRIRLLLFIIEPHVRAEESYRPVYSITKKHCIVWFEQSNTHVNTIQQQYIYYIIYIYIYIYIPAPRQGKGEGERNKWERSSQQKHTHPKFTVKRQPQKLPETF